MKQKFILLENEEIDFEIKKKRKFPFLVSDLLYVFIIFIFSVIFQTISFSTIHVFSSETFFTIIPILVFVFFIGICFNQFYDRYINIFKWKIYLTNLRLVVIDQKGFLIKEFYFDSFPKLSFNEDAYQNGTLIIGETVRTKIYPYRGYESYSFDLYNIIDVKSIFNYIQNKINLKIES